MANKALTGSHGALTTMGGIITDASVPLTRTDMKRKRRGMHQQVSRRVSMTVNHGFVLKGTSRITKVVFSEDLVGIMVELNGTHTCNLGSTKD